MGLLGQFGSRKSRNKNWQYFQRPSLWKPRSLWKPSLWKPRRLYQVFLHKFLFSNAQYSCYTYNNIHEDFELYQLFMHNFLSHFTYCLQEEWAHFGVRLLTYFCQKGLGQFEIENKQKICNIHKMFLNFINFLWIIFTKPNLLATWLTKFCVITHPYFFSFDLTYTAHINPTNFPNFLTLYYFSSIKSGSVYLFLSSD